MKYKLKIITLLVLGTLSATVMAQAPNQPMSTVAPVIATAPVQAGIVTTSGTGTKIEVSAQTAVNDYSNIGEGNAYEKAVTPLLREISRKKSILELKKLDKEIAKLDEVDKKDTASGFVPMPTPQTAQLIKGNTASGISAISYPGSAPALTEEEATVVKVLMTYGADEDLYAKIAVGDQGGYTVRKGDILPDGRIVVKVNSNFIEVQKAVVTKSKSKSKTEKIFVSAATPSSTASQSGLGSKSGGGFVPVPTGSMPSLLPIPAATITSGSNQPTR